MVTMKEPGVVVNDGTMRKRDSGTQIRSSRLTLGVIVGIAVGGAVLLFAILVIIGAVHVKKKHRREKQELSEANEHGHSDMDCKAEIQSTRHTEAVIGHRPSLHRLLPSGDGDHRYDLTKQGNIQRPAMVKLDSSHETRSFRASSNRDSWPLMSNGPLGHLPGQSTMLRTAAPRGTQNPQWPHRTTSKLGRTISQNGFRSVPSARDGNLLNVMPARGPHRRSTSESQLTTILRSTSQRLKESNRQSLTRNSKSFGNFPGLPPLERLPTPPMRQSIERRQALIDHERDHSQESSVYDKFTARTPNSKEKRNVKNEEDDRPESVISPAPSAESLDSLFMIGTPDSVIPAPLTSPSRRGSCSLKRHTIRISSGGAKDISAQIYDDNSASLFATGPQDTARINKILAAPRRISLASDPFHSSVRSSKPIIPSPKGQGPQPMYLRKATFGQEATSERPANFCSPLCDVSGNVQSPQKRELPEPLARTEPNPFQWSPQEAMQARARQTSPVRAIERRKGHNRSNVFRTANLSQPTSTIKIVHEEPQGVLPLKFNGPNLFSFPNIEPTRSPSPDKSAALSQRRSARPPSLAMFNPTVVISALSNRSQDNSPTLESNDADDVYSPTLSVCNYYSESAEGSEDELFNRNSPLQTLPSTHESRRHGRNSSADLTIFPTHQSQKHPQERLFSFPSLPVDVLAGPISLPARGPPLLPNISSTMLHSSAATPAPPLLTVPDPSHVACPRSEPSKLSDATLSATRESMVETVMMLRRMNSEVSTFSSNSLASANSSTDLPLPSSRSSVVDIESRSRSRGSQDCPTLGRPVSKRPRGLRSDARSDKRDRPRVYKECRKRRSKKAEGSGLIDDLTPVREGYGPVPASKGLGIVRLQFPRLSHDGRNGTIPLEEKCFLRCIEHDTSSKLRSASAGCWSDAMSKPTSYATRHESKMEHPSPQMQPQWKLSGLHRAGVRLMDENVELKSVSSGELGREEGKRPDSLGLYDQDGFLKASPDRERILTARAREERRERISRVRYSGLPDLMM